MYRESLLARYASSREVGAHRGDEWRWHAPVDRCASRLERLGSRTPLEPVAATAACVLFMGTHVGLDECNRLVYYFS